MVQTVAILEVARSEPIVAERIEMSFQRSGKVVSLKNTVNERESNLFFVNTASCVARVVLKIAARSQRQELYTRNIDCFECIVGVCGRANGFTANLCITGSYENGI